MDSILDNALPNGTIIKYKDNIYEIWWYRVGLNSKLYYLVTSSIWWWTLWEIEDLDDLLLRDGEERILRSKFRADSKETQSSL